MVGDTLGNYTIVRPLGRGAMGEVFVAAHTLLKHEVAIKVLRRELSADEELVQRFFNEAIAATRIRHPGIVQVLDFGHKDGAAFCVMELLDGEPLSARIRKRGRLPVVEATRIAAEIASALGAAHKQGIVHRDLKPDNIFLASDGDGGDRAKVLDFGIAKLGRDTEGAAAVATHEGSILGTPLYMSPEQCRAQPDVDARADIYALGCVLFEMLAGKPPFPGKSVGEVLGAHQHVAPPTLRSVSSSAPAVLSVLVGKMLAKSAEARPQSMREVQDVLRPLAGNVASSDNQATAATAVASSSEALAKTVAPTRTPAVASSTLGGSAAEATSPRRGRNRTLLAGAAAVAVVAAAATAFVRMRPRSTVAVLREPLVIKALPVPAKVHKLPTIDAAPGRDRDLSTRAGLKTRVDVVNGKRVIVIESRFHHFGKVEKPSVVYILSLPVIEVDPETRTLVHGANPALDRLRARYAAAERERVEASKGFDTARHEVERRNVGSNALGDKENARVVAEWQPRLDAARAAAEAARNEMLSLLDAAASELTPDGLLLLTRLEHGAAEQRAANAMSDDFNAEVPKADFARALRAAELSIARPGAGDRLVEALFMKGAMLAETAVEPAAVSVAANAFWRIVFEFPDSPLATDANLRVGDLLFDTRVAEEIERAAAAFRWLAEAEGVAPDQRAHALYKLGWTASRLDRRRDAVAAFCALLELPRNELSREAARMAAITVFEAEHVTFMTLPNEDLMTPACQTGACPCIPPVIAETAVIYGEQGLDKVADELVKRLDEPKNGVYAPLAVCGWEAAIEHSKPTDKQKDALTRFAPGSDWMRAHEDVVRNLGDPDALMRCQKMEQFMSAALESTLPRAVNADASLRHESTTGARKGRDSLETAALGALPIFRGCQRRARNAGRPAKGPFQLSFRVTDALVATKLAVTPAGDADLVECLRGAIDRVRWVGLGKRDVRLDVVFSED